jgi:Family of unknown function (DUF6516)
MVRATPVLREKVIDEEGNITELAIWHVPRTRRRGTRVRYRLAFIRCGETTPAVLYDNHVPKGDHRHVEGVEEPYEFRGVEQLIADFSADVQRLKGELSWPKRR